MAATIPSSYIENYSRSLNEVNDKAKAALAAALARIDYTRPVDEVREAVNAVMQAACGASTDLTAMLAARFYEGLRERMGGGEYKALTDSMRKPEATEGAVVAFVQVLVDGDGSDELIRRCVGRLDYENRRAAKACTAHNAERDPVRPLYALVPTGDETCEYCTILASFGFTANSQALEHTHENCDCRLIPSWDRKTEIDGYQGKLESYREFYKQITDMRDDPDMPFELAVRIETARSRHAADLDEGTVTAKWGSMNELAIIARWIRSH